MAGVTIQGTIWAQWVHAVSTGGTHTLNVVMNNRDITVLTALRSYSVIHPAQYHIGVFGTPVPPSLEAGTVGVSEVEWFNGDTLQAPASGWPAFVMYGARRIKFKLFDADAVLAINYWNIGEVFAP
jgi:hypothetical protein